MLGRKIHKFRALVEYPLNGGEFLLRILFGIIIGMFVDGHVAGHDAICVVPVRLEVFIELGLSGAMNFTNLLDHHDHDVIDGASQGRFDHGGQQYRLLRLDNFIHSVGIETFCLQCKMAGLDIMT
jgi:hypothetical protein